MATAFEGVKPFPGAASQAAAPMGHNRPPLEEVIVADFEEGLRAVAGLMPRIDALIERGKAAGPCTTEEMAGRYGDYLKMVRDIAGAGGRIENEREKHNRPLLTAQRTLKARSDALIGRLNDAAKIVKTHLDAYMTEQRRLAAEKQRLADEQAQAARDAAEAKAREQAKAAGGDVEAVEVAQPVIDIPPAAVEEPVVRGDYGARVGSTTVWRHEIESVRKLPDNILKHEKVVEAINKVLAAQIRGGARAIKGCRIWSEQSTTIR